MYPGDEETTAPKTTSRGVRFHTLSGVKDEEDESSDYQSADCSSSTRRLSSGPSSKPAKATTGKGSRKKKTYVYESIAEARERIRNQALQGAPYRDVGTKKVKQANRRNSKPPRFFCSLCLKDGKSKDEGFTHVFRCWCKWLESLARLFTRLTRSTTSPYLLSLRHPPVPMCMFLAWTHNRCSWEAH
jgi:hypothetical protein